VLPSGMPVEVIATRPIAGKALGSSL